MTQSIIVYRNPMEAMFWESGMMFPIMVGVVIGLFSGMIADKLIRTVAPKLYRNHGGTAVFVVASVMTIAVIWFML